MAKYEIMLVIGGNDIDAKKAEEISKKYEMILSNKEIQVTEYGLRDLAYAINKQTKAYYTQFNFESDDISSINELRRIANIDKAVLRSLIINLDKDYGAKKAANEKKCAAAQKSAAITKRREEETRRRREERAKQLAAQTETPAA